MITAIHGLGLRELIKETQKFGPSWHRLASGWTKPSLLPLEHPQFPAALWSLVWPCDYILTNEMHRSEADEFQAWPITILQVPSFEFFPITHDLGGHMLKMAEPQDRRKLCTRTGTWRNVTHLSGTPILDLAWKRNKFLVFLSHWDLGCICHSIVLP